MPCPMGEPNCNGPSGSPLSCSVVGCDWNKGEDPRLQLKKPLDKWVQQSREAMNTQQAEPVVLTNTRRKLFDSVNQLREEINSD